MEITNNLKKTITSPKSKHNFFRVVLWCQVPPSRNRSTLCPRSRPPADTGSVLQSFFHSYLFSYFVNMSGYFLNHLLDYISIIYLQWLCILYLVNEISFLQFCEKYIDSEYHYKTLHFSGSILMDQKMILKFNPLYCKIY